MIGAVCGGMAAGILGAAAWAALAYFAGVESGIVAWGIGGIVGFGTALGSRGGSPATALIAVLITVVAICAGKYLAVYFTLNKFFDELPAGAEQDRAKLVQDAFLQSFGILDIIFFLLAIVTAWQIALNDPE